MYIDDIILDALDGFPELQISSLEPLTRREANNILRFYDGMLSHDPDAKILAQREAEAKARAAREAEFYRLRAIMLQKERDRYEAMERHRKLVACLASGTEPDFVIKQYQDRSRKFLVPRTHGHSVPQDARDNGLIP
jgi:hypothetical protein